MDKEFRTTSSFIVVALFLLVFSATFQGSFSAANQPQNKKKPTQSTTAARRFGSSSIFPVRGNVYPDGVFTVSLKIGTRTQPYALDIDTGSDLTWVQCNAPCVGCTKSPESLYKPNNNVVRCTDPVCVADLPGKYPCKTPNEQCDYEVEYADHGSSIGVLVRDSFPVQLINGSRFSPLLAFGCGYNQQFSHSSPPLSTDGVLGLGIGKSSIVSQLSDLGLTRNVLGHCLSGRGGGFLFFGDDLVPSKGITWAPMSHNSLEKHYTSGPAELVFGGQNTGVKGLLVVFDSGSSYTYFSSQAYKAMLSLVRKDLIGKPLKDAAEDQSLPVCWKGLKRFGSVRDVKNYFKPLVLSFTNAKNVQLEIPPESYLIVTKNGNACLGILNGTEVGLDNLNIIGDISMLDKMVIYDNEKQQIGWASANCDRLPKS